MVELRADLAAGGDAPGPVDDGAVAGPAPVRGDLLGPLVGRVHRVRPADRVVVVRLGRPEQVDLGGHELGGLEPGRAVQAHHLVERAVDLALGRRPVVADDVVDEGVVEDLEVRQRVDQPADLEVGVLEEPGVHLHLAREHRLEVVGHVVPGRDLVVPRGELGVGRDHAQGLLAREDLLPQPVPALVEPALVAVAERRRDVMRRVGGPRRVVHEERLVRHQRLLLADPGHGPIGHVLAEVVALLGRLRRLDGGRAVVDRRVVLVGLAADEAVEVLEAAARAGPGVERAQRAGLPDRDLVALAELGGRVAVEAERQRQRRAVVGAQGAVAGRGRGELGDDAHADGVVVAAREQGGAGGRAQGRRVEAVESEAVRRPGARPWACCTGRRRRSRRRSRRRRAARSARSGRPPAAAAARSAGTARRGRPAARPPSTCGPASAAPTGRDHPWLRPPPDPVRSRQGRDSPWGRLAGQASGGITQLR